MESLSAQIITLDKLHRLALDNGISFASYRLPNATRPVTMLQWEHAPVRFSDFKSIESQSGFVFAPFDFDSGIPARIIQPDLIVEGDVFQEIKKKETNPLADKLLPSDYIFTDKDNYVTTRQEFVAQVEQVKKLISRNTIKKVVLSRIAREEKPAGFESSSFFAALSEAYPDVFVFAVYIPDAGLWFGATPEPLLIADQDSVSTVSLAGTRKFSGLENNVPWGEKEIDEQNIVTEYIGEILKKFCVQSFHKSNLETQRAGSIEHLKTSFTFDRNDLCEDLSSFLAELHPTPSVCGLPKDISMQIIKYTEKHSREYYTGFLGPINIKSQWNLFVNLRSMKTHGNFLEYYLGAGITKGSDPEREWEETTNKMNTLKTIVDSIQ